MRQIKVTYRAVFQQPKGKLNPMGLKLTMRHPVEVYGAGEHWMVREIETAKRQQYKILGQMPSAVAAKMAAEDAFERILEPWQVWGEPPAAASARMLEPHEYRELDRKVWWIEPEDLTHIIHAAQVPPGKRIPPAACGATLPAKCFVNNLANVEPTCPGCAEIWRQHYQRPERYPLAKS